MFTCSTHLLWLWILTQILKPPQLLMMQNLDQKTLKRVFIFLKPAFNGFATCNPDDERQPRPHHDSCIIFVLSFLLLNQLPHFSLNSQRLCGVILSLWGNITDIDITCYTSNALHTPARIPFRAFLYLSCIGPAQQMKCWLSFFLK